MATGPQQLSGPAIDYGRAMCLPDTDKSHPWDQLTPGQQQCVREVGGTFEHKVEEKMGYQGGDPPVPTEHHETAPIHGPTGQTLGQVDFDRGVVTVCWTQPPANTPKGCDFVGYGFDAFVSAQMLLDSLGFRTG